eukprot:jgi/Ulvmu1/8893/UM049_0075.1
MSTFSAQRSFASSAQLRACASKRTHVQTAAISSTQVRMAVLGAASAVLLTVPPMGHASDFFSKVQTKKDAEKMQMSKLEKLFEQEVSKKQSMVAKAVEKADAAVN